MANIDIGGRLHSTATGNVVAGANEILDDNEQKKQSQINAELIEAVENLSEEMDTKQGTITAVVTPEIEEDGGDPEVEASFENNQLNLEFKNLKGDQGNRGNGITSIETQESQVDGEVNTVTIKTTDNPTGQAFQVRNGRQGPQGDSVLVGEGDLPLAHTLGQDGTKAMSQKGVTDALNEGKISGGETTSTQNVNYYNNGSTSGLYVDASTGEFVASASNRSIELDLTIDMKTITYTASAYQSLNGGYAFVKDDGTYVSGAKTTSAVNVTADVRQAMAMGATKFRCSKSTTSGSSIALTIKKETFSWPQVYTGLGDNTDGWMTQKAVKEALSVVVTEFSNAQIKSKTFMYYIDSSNKKYASTTGNNYARLIAFDEYRGYTVAIKAASRNAQIAFLKSFPPAYGQNADFCSDTDLIAVTASSTFVMTVPSDCNYLYVRDQSAGNDVVPEKIMVSGSINKYLEDVSEKMAAMPTVYVNETTGNDSNPGTAALPKATISAALNAGTSDMTVVLLSDIHVSAAINLANWDGKKSHVRIRSGRNGQARIIFDSKLEGLEAYEGYDDIYTYTPSGTLSLDIRYWLWQHGLMDENSRISNALRHPLQRGRACRRLSTRLGNKASLAELLEAASPCWTIDNNVLYLRVVAGSDVETNPIYIPQDGACCLRMGSFNVTLCNIEAWYGCIFAGLHSGNGDYLFEAKDCGVHFVKGSGGWQIDDAISVHLERCEVEGVNNLGTGDGFNLHPTLSTGTPNVKGSTHTLIDCWAHDCYDDGYSDHARSEGTIIGGLFEYCGKGGVLPSYGSHDTLYNVTARYCNSGIYCAGEAQDGGMGTQVVCHGCVSTNNTYNYRCQGKTSGDEQIKLDLNNCISRSATETAIKAERYCEIVVRDCTDSGSPSAKSAVDGGIITIDNGTIIE